MVGDVDTEPSTHVTRVGCRLKTLRDEMPWRRDKKYIVHEWLYLHRYAIECNLDIHYAKVDEKRRVNDDRSLNKFVEVWLEFGPIKQVVSDGHLHLQHSHDINLDCGAPTFDEALIKLARLVQRHYGNIKTPKWMAPRSIRTR